MYNFSINNSKFAFILPKSIIQAGNYEERKKD